ncbi:MAG: hypothetical protein AAF614_28295 [Chloroflexota bacterium]
MSLNAPTQMMWIIAVVLGVLGIIAHLGVIGAAIGAYAFWLVVLGLVILAASTVLKGM